MQISRRQVFQFGQKVLAISVIKSRLFGGDIAAKEADLLSMSRETFNSVLRSTFITENAERISVPLVLTAVQDATAAVVPGAAVSLDTFTLEFSSAGQDLPQGTYRFRQATLGTITLFIVPSGSHTYMAVINHLKTALPPNYSIPRRAKPVGAPAVAGTRPVGRGGIQAAQKALANG